MPRIRTSSTIYNSNPRKTRKKVSPIPVDKTCSITGQAETINPAAAITSAAITSPPVTPSGLCQNDRTFFCPSIRICSYSALISSVCLYISPPKLSKIFISLPVFCLPLMFRHKTDSSVSSSRAKYASTSSQSLTLV